jgi:hypothetical protein
LLMRTRGVSPMWSRMVLRILGLAACCSCTCGDDSVVPGNLNKKGGLSGVAG